MDIRMPFIEHIGVDNDSKIMLKTSAVVWNDLYKPRYINMPTKSFLLNHFVDC